MNSNGGIALQGLVLAGGKSRRMGTDKGMLDYGGVSAVQRSCELLRKFVDPVYVSARRDQLRMLPYADLPAIADSHADVGPAGGLLSAWERFADVAWLVLAVDMPHVDAPLLRRLVAARRADRLATAFLQGDGRPEPLCAIFEPACRGALAARVAAGEASLRDFLATVPMVLVSAPDTESLVSVNDTNAYRRVIASDNTDAPTIKKKY